MKTDISIITAVYNAEHFLMDTIKSIYSTIHKAQWELLLRDDFSSDNSWALLKTREFDNRVRIFKSEKNDGAAECKNKLIRETQSDTIMVLDHDNVLCEGVVDKLFEMIKQGKNVAAPEKIQFFSDLNNIDTKNNWDFADMNGICDKNEMITRTMVPPASGNYMFRREVFYDSGKYRTEDYQESWCFGFRHIFKGYPVHLLKGSQYLHRIVTKGNWGTLPKDKMSMAMWQAIRDIDERFLTEDSERALLEFRGDYDKAIKSGRLRLK